MWYVPMALPEVAKLYDAVTVAVPPGNMNAMLDCIGVSAPVGSMTSNVTPPKPALTLLESIMMNPLRVTGVAPVLILETL